MSQFGKNLLKVMNVRLKVYVEETEDDVQFGFKNGTDTRNATFMLRMVMKRAVEKQNELFICFVDFEKAFDRIRHGLLMKCLIELRVDMHKAVVRMGEVK